MPKTARIALVGDIHLFFDDRDVRALDRAGYDLVLFVGDLAGYRAAGGLEVARRIAKLRTPALVIPGNHDGVTGAQLGSEVFEAPPAVREALAIGMAGRVDALAKALGPVPLVGYGVHRFEDLGFTVLSARPHSLGGPRLAFRRYLEQRFSVGTMEASSARLRALLDGIAPGERVIVLAHSGPLGLGATREDIYGCDFRDDEGDFGDPDLADALAHARATGKRVIAVLAGHMHHHLRGGGQRRWHVVKDGVTYVNAARVRRHKDRGHGVEAHHVRVTIEGDGVGFEEVWETLG